MTWPRSGAWSRPSRMQPTVTFESPTRFLVEEYGPGCTIDCRRPAAPERVRFDLADLDESLADEVLLARLGEQLVRLGVTTRAEDLAVGLERFTRRARLDDQLGDCLARLGVGEPPRGRLGKLALVLERTRGLELAHHPVRLYCHVPGGTTRLEGGATHYGCVLDGEATVHEARRAVTTPAGAYFCVAGEAVVVGAARVVVITRFEHLGLTCYGGEIEAWGRLAYIDGCTDSVLVHPARRGDPCYNALYFPRHTRQTRHVHPSLRCGVVIGGEGVCETPFGEHVLRRGKLFFLPPETPHAFHTAELAGDGRAALTVVAFHPDSDFGPTDEDHPMQNRTYFRFLHRLVSAEKVRGGRGSP